VLCRSCTETLGIPSSGLVSSALTPFMIVKAKVGSTGVAGHKPCNNRLSATVWHAQQMREIS